LSFWPRKSPENQVWKKRYFCLFEPIFDGITNLAKMRTFVFLQAAWYEESPLLSHLSRGDFLHKIASYSKTLAAFFALGTSCPGDNTCLPSVSLFTQPIYLFMTVEKVLFRQLVIFLCWMPFRCGCRTECCEIIHTNDNYVKKFTTSFSSFGKLSHINVADARRVII